MAEKETRKILAVSKAELILTYTRFKTGTFLSSGVSAYEPVSEVSSTGSTVDSVAAKRCMAMLPNEQGQRRCW